LISLAKKEKPQSLDWGFSLKKEFTSSLQPSLLEPSLQLPS
jgi:hypothetical protein